MLPDRLAEAYMYNLIQLQPAQTSGSVWARFAPIRARLTREPAVGDEGTIVATTRLMSEGEAREIIDVLVDLYGQTASEAGR